MGAALLVCRLALASVFAIAGVAKLADLSGTRRAVAEFSVPERLAGRAAIALPALELAVAVALIPTAAARAGAVAAALLLAAFIGAIAAANARGRAPDCHCFGQLQSAPAGRATIFRNATLLGVAVFVAIAGAGDTATAAPLVATAAVVALATAVPRRRAPQPRIGLPPGAPAPHFGLQDSSGATRLVLVFTDAECTTCRALLPEIEAAQRRARRAGVAVVTSDDRALAEAYRIPGTPMAVVIDADGRIERPALAGPDAISEALAELVPFADEAAELGDPIPDLVLPGTDGRRLALRDLYRDPTVVLFWDPHCEFSRQMLPGLQAFEREAPPGAPRLIVIGVGEIDDPPFTSPLLYDPDGHARTAFGARGTPMAVLLSEDQVASPVAAGARMVFNLIDAATLATH